MDIQRSAQHSNLIREGGGRMAERENASQNGTERKEGKESDTHLVQPVSCAAFFLTHLLGPKILLPIGCVNIR